MRLAGFPTLEGRRGYRLRCICSTRRSLKRSASSQNRPRRAFSSGVRPSLSGIDFDFGFTYFLYPGEVSTTGTDYWEFAVRADKQLTEKVRVAAGFGYSPSVSNTGAWSKYTAAGIRV